MRNLWSLRTIARDNRRRHALRKEKAVSDRLTATAECANFSVSVQLALVSRRVPGRPCIFCNQVKKMSGEHIWGDWLKGVVPIAMNKHNFRAERLYRPGMAPIAGTTIRTGDPLRSKVRVVCADCNNRWLSGIQSAGKPRLILLIQGNGTGLGPAAQLEVATWCAMATMTAEFIDRDPKTIAITADERKYLMDNRVPPSTGWRIWIARYRRNKWVPQWIHFTFPILGAQDTKGMNPGDFAYPNTQATTFVIGELLVHALSSTGYPELSARWVWPPRTRVSTLLTQIWPPRESFIAWPPAALTDRDADFVPAALRHVIDGASRTMMGRQIF
jgi:hypothetical protein